MQVHEAIGDDEGIANAKSNIAIAKSKYEVGGDQEALKASQELYNLHVAKLVEEKGSTIHAGTAYALHLQTSNRGGGQGNF